MSTTMIVRPVYDFACPKCEAAIGAACLTVAGKTSARPHKERTALRNEALEVAPHIPAGNAAGVVLIGTLTPRSDTVHRIMDAAGTTCKESVMTHNRRAAFFAELAAPSLCRKCGWPA